MASELELFNTLSGTVQPLKPSNGRKLRMYACGPTVYDYGHIGNFRTFLHVDVLRRFLKQQGVAVEHVMNVTDVDDKIIRNAAAAGKSIEEYSAKFEKAFFEDMAWLGIETPEHLPRATESVPEMVALIEKLAAKDIAYQIEDGSWYFRIAKFPEYGKLAKKDFEGLEDGARVDVEEYDKDAARDFAVWKAVKGDERHWETSLGPGRPGWHIECSAMATKYLGECLDLHAGGEDLMFPHHENEIAQSESASGGCFARHWMHVRFLLVEGRKMSKSENNFFTLRDLLLKGHRASAIRFLLISVPYRHQMNFTFDGLRESTNAIERLRTFKGRLQQGRWPEEASAQTGGNGSELLAEVQKAGTTFTAALANDLNTAEARAAIFDMIRAVNVAADRSALHKQEADAALAVLDQFDAVFAVLEDRDAEITRAAIAWAEHEDRMDEVAPELMTKLAMSEAEIDALIAERTQAKKTRNFARADAIRNELLAKGILLEDSKDGVRWRRQ